MLHVITLFDDLKEFEGSQHEITLSWIIVVRKTA